MLGFRRPQRGCPLLGLLVPLLPCPSLGSASAACVLPTPSAPSPLPPIQPHPLATPIAPLTPFPQEHPGSSVPLPPPQEALPGCASPVARATPACPYLWTLHLWSPQQSTQATPQVLSSSLSPGHPVVSDPNGDRSGPLHSKVPEPPFPTPQASASQPPPPPPGTCVCRLVGGMRQRCLGEGSCSLLPGLEQEGGLPKGWPGRGRFLILLREGLYCFCPNNPWTQH